ncbi:RNA polymerase sigma factor [Demequina oxidasica]|uniref:RNA polymerase sigma factor n=1 Tax=Demequina oxidasica TaxID=676199 RepID=UPI0007836FBD|nr:sigma-70 family RNA polymerase sigma factor [Demequina oxidasica]
MRQDPMLTRLLDERYSALVGYAVVVTGARPDAEDAVHDALISVFSRRRKFQSLQHAEGYVKRAIASRYIDSKRSGASRAARELRSYVRDTPRVAPAPEDQASGDAALVAAMRSLAPRVRACVALRYLADQSIVETARALGLSDGAVKRYTADGLAALSTQLGTDVTAPETAEVITGGTR